MKYEYSVQIAWSKEDHAYLAVAPDLPGCVADGETPEEALANLRVVVKEWIETALEEKREIPPPKSVEDHEKEGAKFQHDLNKYIQKCVEQAVTSVMAQLQEAQEDSQYYNSNLFLL